MPSLSPLPRLHYLHPSNDWYGADVVAFRTVMVLRDAGYDVRVVLPLGLTTTVPRPLVDRLQEAGVQVEYMAMPVLRRRLLSPAGLFTLMWRALVFAVRARKFRGGLIVINTSALALCLPGVRGWGGARVLVHLHETLGRREACLLGNLVGLAHVVVTVSASAQRRLPPWPRRRSIVIENAVDSRVEPRPLPPDRPLQFLFIGRWSPRKGIAELVTCWEAMAEPDRHLTVVGGFPPEGISADLVPGTGDAFVTVIGEVSDVTSLIDACHVVVIPSLQAEGMPLVALEALARGRPVVSTSAGGLGDVIDSTVGWLLSDRPAEWSTVFLGISADEVRDRQAACLRRHGERFSAAVFEAHLVEAIEGLAA